ncbi:tannase/feruloyl esterase family alpha/beta hydrolase [Rhodanobacter sp. Col0626]|uniref:tannase/feruloyl esterase family alpha/beta hydrolase n=1 Tax=Rhodanobacter sp. Col0626 TaxID=3415679 RepID=UPI003CF65C7A
MPASGWNGKFVGVGNGAWAGSITYAAMIDPLSKGYATAATDDGHQGSQLDAGFAAGHPEKFIDFSYRGPHEMTVAAKAVIQAFYGRMTDRSLFVSCSTGGRQALMEAHRYPNDYDGISAMAPANPTVGLMVGSLWTSSATAKEAASRISPATFDLVHKAVLAACDADDGVRDGMISAPNRCHFDPAVLQCKRTGPGAGTTDCLTAPQVTALRAIYQGPRNPRTGKPIFPGFEPGSENMFSIQASGSGPIVPVASYFRDLVFNDPQWDFRHFDYDKDVSRALAAHSRFVDVPPTGLGNYVASGRKLLMSHGWADPLVPPMTSVDFYRALTARLGAKEAANARLFMIPGMAHCTGGDGPFVFDVIAALDQWVATGRAPERIVVSNPPNAPARTRPICPYPQEAVYSGAGSTDDEKNFRCEALKRQPLHPVNGA